jgi:hypothetical protein
MGLNSDIKHVCGFRLELQVPKLTIRKPTDVPPPNRTSKAVREHQMRYEGFIRDIGTEVGELELGTDEKVRGEKVRLRRAATRLGVELEIWDANDRVYFRSTPKRGRPRKA